MFSNLLVLLKSYSGFIKLLIKYSSIISLVKSNFQSISILSMTKRHRTFNTAIASWCEKFSITNTEAVKERNQVLQHFSFSCVRETCRSGLIVCWTLGFLFHNTKLFLILEFSYPSDFLTIKTRLRRRRFGTEEKIFSVVLFLFSRVFFVVFRWSYKNKKKKHI